MNYLKLPYSENKHTENFGLYKVKISGDKPFKQNGKYEFSLSSLALIHLLGVFNNFITLKEKPNKGKMRRSCRGKGGKFAPDTPLHLQPSVFKGNQLSVDR